MGRLWSAVVAAVLATSPATWAQTPAPTHVVTNPYWVKLPDAADMTKYYPATAGHDGGSVRIRCVVASTGALESCTVLSETPEGQGFGAAAVALSATFQMRPKTVDGVPTGDAVVNIPIHFAAPPASPVKTPAKA